MKKIEALAPAPEEYTERNWRVSTFPNAQQFRNELENENIKLKNTVFRFLEDVYRKYNLSFETVKYQPDCTVSISINDIILGAHVSGVVMYNGHQVYFNDQITDDFEKLCLEGAA